MVPPRTVDFSPSFQRSCFFFLPFCLADFFSPSLGVHIRHPPVRLLHRQRVVFLFKCVFSLNRFLPYHLALRSPLGDFADNSWAFWHFLRAKFLFPPSCSPNPFAYRPPFFLKERRWVVCFLLFRGRFCRLFFSKSTFPLAIFWFVIPATPDFGNRLSPPEGFCYSATRQFPASGRSSESLCVGIFSPMVRLAWAFSVPVSYSLSLPFFLRSTRNFGASFFFLEIYRASLSPFPPRGVPFRLESRSPRECRDGGTLVSSFTFLLTVPFACVMYLSLS